MQKIYLLLRANRQSGPYTLEELLSMELQPKDLVWVEGRSAGWSYPSEVDTLRPFLGAAEATTAPAASAEQNGVKASKAKHVFVSLPAGRGEGPTASTSIEDKAEAIRRRAMEAADAASLQTNYTRSLDDVESAYTSWVVTQKVKKKKKFKPAHYAAVAIILTGLAGGWWIGGEWNQKSTKSADEPVKVTGAASIPTEEKSAGPEPLVVLPAADEKTRAATATAQPVLKTSKPGIKAMAKKVTPPENPVVTTPEPNEVYEKVADPGPEVATAPPSAEKKKKSLKETIGGFFKKLGGKEETPAAGERNAQKRDAAPADLSHLVKVTMNAKSDEWMMGVQGLTITLHNKSGYPLQSALVEVLYYREDQTLIEKKTVRFGPLASGRSATLPAPDHRMADHAGYAILSAQADDAAYARQ